MLRIRHVVLWQSVPSPHQAGFIRALAKCEELASVHCAYEMRLPEQRLRMGWRQPDFGAAHSVVEPQASEIQTLVQLPPRETAHVFTGLVNRPWVRHAYDRLRGADCMRGLITEGRDYRGVAAPLRWLHGFARERRWRNDIDFALVMGGIGENWFIMNGYETDRLYRFGYVVDEVEIPRSAESAQHGFAIAFVGQLNRGKRVELLLRALAELPDSEVRLTIVGNGPEMDSLVSLSRRLGVSGRVDFLGVKPNEDVRKVMSASDLLVLPSAYDGWGAVVNEALMCGTPVVVSDNCGSADVVRPGFNGQVFQRGNLPGLRTALEAQIVRGKVGSKERAQIKDWSRSLSGESMAAYIIEVLKFTTEGRRGAKPQPPWIRAVPQ